MTSLIDFSVDSVSIMYKDMLMISNEKDLQLFHHFRNEKSSQDLCSTISVYLSNRGRDTFHDTAKHYAKDSLTVLSSFRNGVFETGMKMDDVLNEMYYKQLKLINQGNVIVINKNLAWHYRKRKDMYITKQDILDSQELKDYILGKYSNKYDTIEMLDNDKIFFVIDKNCKTYSVPDLYNHDQICSKMSLNCDEVLKLVYYAPKHKFYTLYNEYGIQGLALSIVYGCYDTYVPFEITDSVLKSIETFISKVNKKETK